MFTKINKGAEKADDCILIDNMGVKAAKYAWNKLGILQLSVFKKILLGFN